MQVTNEAKIVEYYEALVQRKPEYLGSFYVGVRTTGIFCIATCRARKPKPENVTFYTELKDALDHGYRPCKVCLPTEHGQLTPPEIEQAIALVQANPKQKVSDQQLREEGLHPVQIRRWFKQHYGITFHTYQRMFRINIAYQELQQGQSTTATAYGNGYESLSGFGYTYKKLTGKAPSKSSSFYPIYINRLNTPLGPMFVCATDQGICLLEFVDRRMLETEFEDLQKRLKATIIYGENEHVKQLRTELAAYFAQERKHFDVPLHAPGTDFQQQVWKELCQIPLGATRSYQGQAIAIGNPNAVRAVARANGMNRIAIVIPCHRVIGKDGSLTGYAGGLERKKWLLDHEQSF